VDGPRFVTSMLRQGESIHLLFEVRSKGVLFNLMYAFHVLTMLQPYQLIVINKSINGAEYKKKTSEPICEELKKDENMRAYILEYGKTTLESPDGDEL